MRRQPFAVVAGLALVAGTLVFGSTGTVGAAPADGCNGKELHKKGVGLGGSDIIGGDTDFVAVLDDTGGIIGYDITVHLVLESASCAGVTYTATLYDPKDGTPIGSAAASGDDTNSVVSLGPIRAAPEQLVQTPFPNPPPDLQTCVNASATTSNGAKVLDSAPDSGTIEFCDPDSGLQRFR